MDKNTKDTKLISSSMRCPALDIALCLEKSAFLFEKNGTSKIKAEKLYLDLGISKDSGYSGRLVTSMKYYGFIEEDNGEFKLNLDIADYALDKKITFDLVLTAIRNVPVNKKLFSTYDIDELPIENVIKSFLIKQCNYSMKKAQEYWIIFNKNMQLYKLLKNNGSASSLSIVKDVGLIAPNTTGLPKDIREIEKTLQSPQQVLVSSSDDVVMCFPTGDKEVKFILPKELTKMTLLEIEDLEDVLELLAKKISRYKKTIV